MLYKKGIIEFMVLPKLWIISPLDSTLKFQQLTKNSFSPFNLMDYICLRKKLEQKRDLPVYNSHIKGDLLL